MVIFHSYVSLPEGTLLAIDVRLRVRKQQPPASTADSYLRLVLVALPLAGGLASFFWCVLFIY